MYVITIRTPANDDPNKMVRTYYCKQMLYNGIECIEWDEDIKYAARFSDKMEAKKIQSMLRKLKGSERAKIGMAIKFSKN